MGYWQLLSSRINIFKTSRIQETKNVKKRARIKQETHVLRFPISGTLCITINYAEKWA